MPRIVVVGSINVDFTFRLERIPQPGETVVGSSFAVGYGGKGANQAVVAARMGAQVRLIGAVGDDLFAGYCLTNLRNQGVDVDSVYQRAGHTGAAGIVVDDTAENAIVVVPGANNGLTRADIEAAMPSIQQADFVVAQLETPVEVTRELFRQARAAGVRTVLNPSPLKQDIAELLPLCDLCVVNETELAALTLMPIYTADRVSLQLDALLAQGPAAVLVTLGTHGSVYQDRKNVTHRVPAFAVQAVDPTAAGDAYVGNLVVDLAAGKPLPEAMRRSSAVAALTVTRPGAQGAFPTREEVEAFLAAR